MIRLQHTRDSLLGVTALLPLEILGNIFHWNAILDGTFGRCGLLKVVRGRLVYSTDSELMGQSD